MTKDLADGRAVVLRATSSLIAFWALAGLAALFVVDAATRGRFDVALRTAGIAVFIVWCAWVFLVRMSVRVDSSALTARNLLRWVRMPWGRIVDIERRAQLIVTLDDQATVSCWGSPFASRRGARAPRDGQQGEGTGDTGLDTMRAAWLAHPQVAGDVTRGWDVPALVIGTVCLVCAIVAAVT